MDAKIRTNYYVVPLKSHRGVPKKKMVSEMEAKNAIKTGKYPFEVWPDHDSFHLTVEIEVDVYQEIITTVINKLYKDKTKQFEEKYSNNEIELPEHICVIKDDYPCSFCSGSNGYITKLRIHDDKFEYYLDWWGYGWYDANDGKYPEAIEEALNQLL